MHGNHPRHVPRIRAHAILLRASLLIVDEKIENQNIQDQAEICT